MSVKSQPVGSRLRVDLIALILVLVAVVLAAGYYQEGLFAWFRLRGWESGAVRQMTERFVREAYDGKPSAGELLDPAWCQPVVEGGKLVGVKHEVPGVLAPRVDRFKSLFPAGEVKDCRVRVKPKAGVFQADVQFPNGKWAPFEVDRVRGSLRIRSVPGVLSPAQPAVQTWD
jgi:hypothetical protein